MASGTRGRIAAVCVGLGGLPNTPKDEIQVTPEGVIGDSHSLEHHGGADRALCLLSLEDKRALLADGVLGMEPGSFAENVLTEGLDFAQLRPGHQLMLGESVQIELFDVRSPCATLKGLDPRMPDLMLGRSGFLCRVLTGGILRAGMPVSVIEQLPKSEG